MACTEVTELYERVVLLYTFHIIAIQDEISTTLNKHPPQEQVAQFQ